MTKLVVFLLGLALVAWVAMRALEEHPRIAPGESSEQKRQLDRIRARARELERQDQQRVDDAVRRADPQNE